MIFILQFDTIFTNSKIIVSKKIKQGGNIMNKDLLIEELESYRFDLQYYQERTEDIEKMKQNIEKHNIALNDMRFKHYNTFSLELKIKKLIDTVKTEENNLAKLNSKNKSIETKIDNMSQPFKNIFFLKYIKGYSFDEIASKMNYSSKRIYQLHKEGIQIYREQYSNLSLVEIINN